MEVAPMKWKTSAALCLSAVLVCLQSASALEPRSGARLRFLDKITGNASDISAKVGESIVQGRLKVTVRACHQAPPEDKPEAAAFLEIRPVAAADGEEGDMLFSGWMFASSPGLSALEHPVYDVWVISCSASAPVR
jgi:hypothetical protein